MKKSKIIDAMMETARDLGLSPIKIKGIDSLNLIKLIPPHTAEPICRAITSSLPEWFGQSEANERYAKGVSERISFAAFDHEEPVGLLTLEFQYPENGNIYWLGVKKSHHHQGVGAGLMEAAQKYCIQKQCQFITVETLSEKNLDAAYLKTYEFYKKHGFQPLFEMPTYGPECLMVYMLKKLSL